MPSRREVVRTVLEHERPPWVPWNIGTTEPARARPGALTGAKTATRAVRSRQRAYRITIHV